MACQLHAHNRTGACASSTRRIPSFFVCPHPLYFPVSFRRRWHSPYLLACWDPDSEELQSVCRCMSGFSDAFYKEALGRWAGV